MMIERHRVKRHREMERDRERENGKEIESII